MTRARRLLCYVYVFIAALALVATWRHNLAFMADAHGGGFASFWHALFANHATTSITVDIGLFMLAAVIWMVLEARRVGVRFVWLYVLFAMTIAISVTFPLFLVARERRLAARGDTATEPEPTAADVAGLAVFGVAMVATAIWIALR